jgi:hypothetical protein
VSLGQLMPFLGGFVVSFNGCCVMQRQLSKLG